MLKNTIKTFFNRAALMISLSLAGCTSIANIDVQARPESILSSETDEKIELSGKIYDIPQNALKNIEVIARIAELNKIRLEKISLNKDGSFRLTLPKIYSTQEISLTIKPFFCSKLYLTKSLHVDIHLTQLPKDNKNRCGIKSGVTYSESDADFNLALFNAYTSIEKHIERNRSRAYKLRQEYTSESIRFMKKRAHKLKAGNTNAKNDRYIMARPTFLKYLAKINKLKQNNESLLKKIDNDNARQFIRTESNAFLYAQIIKMARHADTRSIDNNLWLNAMRFTPSAQTQYQHEYYRRYGSYLMGRLYIEYYADNKRPMRKRQTLEEIKHSILWQEQLVEYHLKISNNPALEEKYQGYQQYLENHPGDDNVDLRIQALINVFPEKLDLFAGKSWTTKHTRNRFKNKTNPTRLDLAILASIKPERWTIAEQAIYLEDLLSSPAVTTILPHLIAISEKHQLNNDKALAKATKKLTKPKTRILPNGAKLLEFPAASAVAILAYFKETFSDKAVVIKPIASYSSFSMNDIDYVNGLQKQLSDDPIEIVAMAYKTKKSQWIDIVEKHNIKGTTLWLSYKQSNEMKELCGDNTTYPSILIDIHGNLLTHQLPDSFRGLQASQLLTMSGISDE